MLSGHKYNVMLVNGVKAEILVDPRKNILSPFEGKSDCPVSWCDKRFSYKSNSLNRVKTNITDKLRKHWNNHHTETLPKKK